MSTTTIPADLDAITAEIGRRWPGYKVRVHQSSSGHLYAVHVRGNGSGITHDGETPAKLYADIAWWQRAHGEAAA